jgi:excisionase family DNA binding protein
MQRQLLNEKEVSELLGIQVRTLQRWRVLGQGPIYRKLGGSVRYHLDDLNRWLEESKVIPVERA